MNFLSDAFALPGTLGRGITGHTRNDSATTDATVTTVSQAPGGLFSPLRRLLRTSQDPGDSIAQNADPETPPNPINERPENRGLRIQVLRAKLDQVGLTHTGFADRRLIHTRLRTTPNGSLQQRNWMRWKVTMHGSWKKSVLNTMWTWSRTD